MEDRTIILNKEEIKLKIERIAHEIHENYFEEKEVVLIGIEGKGYEFAKRLLKLLGKFDSFKCKLIKIIVDKKDPHKTNEEQAFFTEDLDRKAVLIVDDVLNSGRTLAYGVKFILRKKVKSLRTVVLVNREHHAFPVTADFVGLSLATTMREHIDVEFGGKSEGVYLL